MGRYTNSRSGDPSDVIRDLEGADDGGRSVNDELLRSFDFACDQTLVSLERTADLLTNQMKHLRGVYHLHDNWGKFRDAVLKLQDIYIDQMRFTSKGAAE